MSTWMEILNSKHSETNRTNNLHSHSEQSLRGGGGGGVGERQKRLRKSSGNSSSSPVASAAGFLETLKSKFIGAEDSVRYVSLNQNDLEKGPRTSLVFANDDCNTQLARNKIASNSGDSSSSNSSSEEDLFVTSSRRKYPRRKMTRKGTYSMRETYENSRQVSWYFTFSLAWHHNLKFTHYRTLIMSLNMQ